MTLENILSNLPEYAKDIKLNFSSILNNHSIMSETQFYGTLLAASLASKNITVTAAIKTETAKHLDEKNINAVYAAATLMAMNNIYYRFTDLIEDDSFAKMPAGLRMNVMRDHGARNTDFEIWSLSVSVINGCSMCITAHARQLQKAEISNEVIQLTAKIAAIVHALSSITN